MNGDYLILEGSTGTAVFKIDASSDIFAIAKIEGSADTTGNHWFKDNGSYVLESKSGTGKVKVWKWNGLEAPTSGGEVDVNGSTSGNVQAICFDPEDPAKAYFYCKLAEETGNGGNVYSVDLTNPTVKTLLFKFPSIVIQISGQGSSARLKITLPAERPRSTSWFLKR
ncbi:MAG: hypothetical protein LBB43_07405 [Spirochaetaceae bacterium]|nr:hypothetical protein [Spirochaetaceae bacterium]